MIFPQTKAKAKQLKKNDPVLKELSEKLVHIQETYCTCKYPVFNPMTDKCLICGKYYKL